jgi:hypothetical protein
LDEIALSKLCFLVFNFYEFWHKAIFLPRESSQKKIMCDLLSDFQALIIIPEINTYKYFLFF